MLLLPEGVSELRHCCRPESNHATSACAALYRSNRHLHHCLANTHRCAWQSKKVAGERAKSVSVTPTQALPRGRTGARDTTALARPPPRYVTPRAGFEPAFPTVRSIRNLHHQRFRGNGRMRIGLAAVVSQTMHPPSSPPKPNCKTNIVVALSNMARHRSEPLLVRPAIGGPRSLAPFPPAGPALSDARDRSREPRDPGLPFSFRFAERTALRRTKNPPERWLGRVRETRTFDIAYARSLP